MPHHLVSTGDGSLTLFHSETRQHYHNLAGAYTEALRHYVLPSLSFGLLHGKTQRLSLLDACYGLGYNTWTLVQHLLTQPLSPGFRIDIVAIERDDSLLSLLPQILDQPCFTPLQTEIPKLNYYINSLLDALTASQRDPTLISSAQEQAASVQLDLLSGGSLRFTLYTCDLRQAVAVLNAQPEARTLDLIYHDPFSPDKAPALWTVDLFQAYHQLLQPAGALLTYSAAGAIRGALQEAGFQLYRTEALGQKSGGTLALRMPDGQLSGTRHIIPNNSLLAELTDTERAYLQTRAGIPYRDPTLSGTPATILLQRQQEQAQSKRPSGSVLKQALQANHT